MTEANEKSETVAYQAPHLLDYGPVSELTQTITGDTGCDGATTPSSYTAST
jgi:hypothetical protein